MNGQNARMKSSVGFTTSSAVVSARWSAMVFGVSSPSVMCSAVINREGDRHREAVRGGFRHPSRQRFEQRLNQHGERRLADPAETQAGHRDAELRRGDIAGGIGDRAAHRARAPRPFRDQLVDARLADGDDREFRRDEKTVRKDQRQDTCQAPEDPSQRILHDVILAAPPEAGQNNLG